MTTTYVAEVKSLFETAKSNVANDFDFTKLSPAEVMDSYLKFMQVKVCPSCKGVGVKRGYYHNFPCKCRGKGIAEGSVKLSHEEMVDRINNKSKQFVTKLQAVITRKQKAIEAKAAIAAMIVKEAEDKRNDFLNSLPEKDRKEFLIGCKENTDDISKDIHRAFIRFGKASEKQVSYVLRKYRERIQNEAASIFYEEYEAGKSYKITAKVKQLKLNVENGTDFRGQPVFCNQLVLLSDTMQQISIKTTSQKLTTLFDALVKHPDADTTWVVVVGTVKYVSTDKRFISLSSKGLTINKK